LAGLKLEESFICAVSVRLPCVIDHLFFIYLLQIEEMYYFDSQNVLQDVNVIIIFNFFLGI
jgi:hypothetical protein